MTTATQAAERLLEDVLSAARGIRVNMEGGYGPGDGGWITKAITAYDAASPQLSEALRLGLAWPQIVALEKAAAQVVEWYRTRRDADGHIFTDLEAALDALTTALRSEKQ